MKLICLGLNHTTAPLAMRERVAFAESDLVASLKALLTRLGDKTSGAFKEALIVSTCNRMEIYGAVEDEKAALDSLLNYLAEAKNIPARELEAYIYSFEGDDAVAHACRVVSGIDSMVLGETQIAGQVKKAVAKSREAGALGLYLNRLTQIAFTAAKHVRSHTAIGRNSVSLSSAAVRLSERIFGDLSQRRVLYIGAGEMIDLCAAHFGAKHPKEITVANRSIERGQALASRYGGTAIRLQKLPEVISHFDVIVSCTASSLPILGLGMVARAVKERHHEPLCIIDLAVPRDVEPEVRELNDVFVYTIDDLGSVVSAGKVSRSQALEKAEALVADCVKTFSQWKKSRETVPAVLKLRERAKALSETELARAKKSLKKGVDPELVLEHLARNLTKKFAHDPTVYLKDAAKDENEKQSVAEFFRPRHT